MKLLRWLYPRGETHALSRSIYLRGLGAIYLVAILSWWVQVETLVGARGLVPMGEFLDQVGEALHVQGYSRWGGIPTLFWIDHSDAFIHAVCAIGVLLAVTVIAGYGVGPCLAGLWFIYLSLLGTGDVFMHFQWDILLVEAGFLAIFFAPWRAVRLPWTGPQPPLGWGERIALWLQWVLIGKLMFQSGWVKLAWATPGQPEWWPEHTAMTFHYLTQPLPTWTAWWMHQLPAWFQKASIWPMYFVEIILPFAVLLGPRFRLVAAIGFAGLMGLITATGNYTFFNYLTAVLCLPLVADRYWGALFGLCRKVIRRKKVDPTGLHDGPDPVESDPPKPVATAAYSEPWELASLSLRSLPLAAILLLNAATVMEDFHYASQIPNAVLPWVSLDVDPIPDPVKEFQRKVYPWHLVNGYGLFRTMTTDRPEIVLEGSVDGAIWREYELRWKPGRLDRRPRFVAPHQPRVAWQFWFAALERGFDRRSRNAPWMSSLVMKLLDNDPVALGLFRENPFPGAPPKMIRAQLYLYEFTTPAERRETGNWWKRTPSGLYLPPAQKQLSSGSAPGSNPVSPRG